MQSDPENLRDARERSSATETAISEKSSSIIRRAAGSGLSIATAESLTAGSLAAALARTPGASTVFHGGVISYTAEVKASVLGVNAQLLQLRGPVDPEVAQQMARGAARLCATSLGISSTGVAGPEKHGGAEVGTVYIGWAKATAADDQHGGPLQGARKYNFDGDRSCIQNQSVLAALQILEELLETH